MMGCHRLEGLKIGGITFQHADQVKIVLMQMAEFDVACIVPCTGIGHHAKDNHHGQTCCDEAEDKFETQWHGTMDCLVVTMIACDRY